MFWSYLRARLVRDEGATMVEYALMVALIAVVAIVAVTALGVAVNDIFCEIAGSLGGDCGGPGPGPP